MNLQGQLYRQIVQNVSPKPAARGGRGGGAFIIVALSWQPDIAKLVLSLRSLRSTKVSFQDAKETMPLFSHLPKIWSWCGSIVRSLSQIKHGGYADDHCADGPARSLGAGPRLLR